MRKLKRVLLAGGDIGILYLALWIMLKIRFGDPLFEDAWQEHFIPFSFLYAFWILIFYTFGLYDLRLAKNNTNFYLALVKSLGVTFVAAVIFFYLTPFFGIAPKTNLFFVCALVFLLLIIWRHIYNLLITYPLAIQNILVIGQHPKAQELRGLLNAHPQLGYSICAILEADPKIISAFQFKTAHIHRVLCAFDLREHPELMRLLFPYAGTFILEPFSSFYERVAEKIPVSQVDEVWFLSNLREREHDLYEIAKRGFDLAVAIILLSIMLIFLPFIAIAIKLETPGSLLYSQERVGKHGRIFRLFKFRSMIEDAEQESALWAQKHDPRVTRAGNILRKTFIDELPQCINILRGEMSFIGPRPERPEFIAQLTKEIPFYQIRHLIRPGITGWAQVNFPYGNSAQDALEKLQYDLYYIKNRSLILDLKILLKTINVIFKGGTQ